MIYLHNIYECILTIYYFFSILCQNMHYYIQFAFIFISKINAISSAFIVYKLNVLVHVFIEKLMYSIHSNS